MTTKRSVALLAAAAASLMALTACSSPATGGEEGGDAATTEELLVVGWGGGYSEATQQYLLDPFTAETGIATSIEDAPGKQIQGLQQQAQTGDQIWDFLDTIPADQALFGYENGVIAKLPDDVKAELEGVLQPGAVLDYGFTSANLGVVIVCNMELVDACPQSAAEFFDTDAFPGARALPAEALESLTFANIANGTPLDQVATSPIDFDAGLTKIDAIRDDITVFWDGGDMLVNTIKNEDAAIVLGWSGRASGLLRDGMDLEIVWNDAMLSPGVFAVAEHSANKEAAFDLLVSIAKNAEGLAGFAEAMNYGVSNDAALALVPEEISANLVNSHLDTATLFNVAWYAENQGEIEDRWREVVSG
ncbi:extracellular solute-binding protein [Leucobacter soli]|uniref:extracellular solute-binding protein n=1 Tax=Leucobacter soli TaxID=2812850 RepID=UPI003616A239